MTNQTQSRVRISGVGPRAPQVYLDQGRVVEKRVALVHNPETGDSRSQPNYALRRALAATAVAALSVPTILGVGAVVNLGIKGGVEVFVKAMEKAGLVSEEDINPPSLR